ncbi:serine/threonine-protein phosphatase 4 regulatory subunit 2-like [Scleropages formosus]|uniref:Protein phosphatase 4, regulatory subunit 2b n=1 Tax=Scleropages formosus TaxID=113540 RepID=A0A0P7U1H6_SCLFO|nr:serine/threonine-protein phosphatase 4 regulatory subunit 2-B-like [Scleropages formosus]KPP67956.1 serine/threonine-protein phosphatase 4 regulatory subunit 2-like [Scleropages formosus]
MEPAAVLEAVRDFEKKGKREVCPILDQFLCHIARTGDTMIQWSQFKSYFLYKLEKVMDDFQASAPEPRRPVNLNVDCIPFEEMKERILKIANGYTGIPFTIQRLCELLTEPKRNYSGTDKFLRGLEKNVMVVSYIYPSSEKNGSVSRMNGVMFPGNSSAFLERNANGPDTPRPLNRPKLTLSSSLATNGVPDSAEIKALNTGLEVSEPLSSSPWDGGGGVGSPVKNKHTEVEDAADTDSHEVKRLKFESEEVDESKEMHCPALTESLSELAKETQSSSSAPGDGGESEEKGEAASSLMLEGQGPSNTQKGSSLPSSEEEKAERRASPSLEVRSESTREMDQSEPQVQPVKPPVSVNDGGESANLVSSSSSSVESGSREAASTSSSEGTIQDASLHEEPMEQD